MTIKSRDIHNHLLPGVDDGFRKEGDSLEAISRLSSLGCKEIVFTPHMNPDVYPEESEEHFKQVYDSFAAKIPVELGVTTSLAAEYMVVKGFEDRASEPEKLLTYADGSILIEMSYYFRSRNLEDAVFQLQLAGLKPIIAHPERYLYMVDSLSDYDKLRDMGCRFQMNYLSLSGCYGPASVKILKYLYNKGYYDFAATDLHSLEQLDRIVGSVPDKHLKKVTF